MTSRTWIKLYCDNWLSGTLREETPALRGIWADLFALAGSGKYGDTGQISLQHNVGLRDLQFQKVLDLSQKGWRKAKNRLGHRIVKVFYDKVQQQYHDLVRGDDR